MDTTTEQIEFFKRVSVVAVLFAIAGFACSLFSSIATWTYNLTAIIIGLIFYVFAIIGLVSLIGYATTYKDKIFKEEG